MSFEGSDFGGMDPMAMAAVPEEVLEAEKETRRQRVVFADCLGGPGGFECLDLMRREIEEQVPDPGAANCNERLWHLEGQRAFLRWVESMVYAGLEVKRNG